MLLPTIIAHWKYLLLLFIPILKQALHCIPFNNFKLGEAHLQCAIKQTADDDAADTGPKIDIIMSHKLTSLEMS